MQVFVLNIQYSYPLRLYLLLSPIFEIINTILCTNQTFSDTDDLDLSISWVKRGSTKDYFSFFTQTNLPYGTMDHILTLESQLFLNTLKEHLIELGLKPQIISISYELYIKDNNNTKEKERYYLCDFE